MDIASAITNLGFPIGLSIFLLTRLEKNFNGLNNAVLGKDGILDKMEEIKTILVGKDGNSGSLAKYDRIILLLTELTKKAN